MPALPQLSNYSPHTTAPSSRQGPAPPLRGGSRVSVVASGSMAHGPAIGTRGRSLSASNPDVSSRGYFPGKHQPLNHSNHQYHHYLPRPRRHAEFAGGLAFGVLSPKPGGERLCPESAIWQGTRSASPTELLRRQFAWQQTLSVAFGMLIDVWHRSRFRGVSGRLRRGRRSVLTPSTLEIRWRAATARATGQARRFRYRARPDVAAPGAFITVPLAYIAGCR